MTREEFDELATLLSNAAKAAVQDELRGLRSDLKQWLHENQTLHTRLTEAEEGIRRLSERVGRIEAEGIPDTERPSAPDAE